MVRRAVHLLLTLMLLVVVVAAVVWATMALWFDGPSSRVLAGSLPAGLVLVSILFAALIRPLVRGLVVALFPVIVVAVWWTSIPPSNDRDWSPDVARTARAAFKGSAVTIENVRDFKYRSESDYDQRWETRTYNLDGIRGVDLFLSFWGPTQIAHTIASWGFDDGQHLAISIETRKAKGESYSALRGFFRQYELYYVVADERDLIGLRTNHRAEQVYLYRIRVPVSQARALLIDYLDELNRLADHPQWYNALTQNCTTTIRGHVQNVGAGGRLDWRLLFNGHLDELLYERGQIDTDLPLADLRARSNITEKAKAAGDSPDFSVRIRQGLPGTSSSTAGIQRRCTREANGCESNKRSQALSRSKDSRFPTPESARRDCRVEHSDRRTTLATFDSITDSGQSMPRQLKTNILKELKNNSVDFFGPLFRPEYDRRPA